MPYRVEALFISRGKIGKKGECFMAIVAISNSLAISAMCDDKSQNWKNTVSVYIYLMLLSVPISPPHTGDFCQFRHQISFCVKYYCMLNFKLSLRIFYTNDDFCQFRQHILLIFANFATCQETTNAYDTGRLLYKISQNP